MKIKKKFIIFLIFISLSACVGSSTTGVFGSGVSIALDPRTLGTQIDDSIMQKNLQARLILSEKKYFIKISVKVLDGRIFLSGKVDEPEEKLNITKMAWETKGIRSVKNNIAIKQKFSFKDVTKDSVTKKIRVSVDLVRGSKKSQLEERSQFHFGHLAIRNLKNISGTLYSQVIVHRVVKQEVNKIK